MARGRGLAARMVEQPLMGFRHTLPADWQSLACAWPDGCDWGVMQPMMGPQPVITSALGLLMMYCKELPCCGMCDAAEFHGNDIIYSMEVITPRYSSSLPGTHCWTSMHVNA